MTWQTIKQTPQFHAHDLEEDVACIKELNQIEKNEEIPFFQFKLPNHDKGRFVGYFDERENGLFHIALYDRNHTIYKRK